MTGSSLAPIVIPIVVMFGLAAWIVMVFHAASHPQWRDLHRPSPRTCSPARSSGRRRSRPDPVRHDYGPPQKRPRRRPAERSKPEYEAAPPGGRSPLRGLIEENDMDTHGQGLASAREEPFS